MEIPNQSDAVEIYANTVAGAFPLGEGVDPLNTVRMLAQEVLHAQNVHVRFSVEDEHVFYIATNSRALSSAPNFRTALAAGLPGHEAHQGDACYYLPLPPNSAAALVRRGNTLKLFTNYAETVLDSCAAEGLERVDVLDAWAEPLESQRWAYRMLSNRIATMTSMASLGIAGLCIVVILVSKAVSGYTTRNLDINVAETVDKANSVLEATPMVQPISEQMSRIQTLSYAVVATGGWIDGYQYKKATGERFVITLPSWVTGEAIKFIGEGLTTEAQPSGTNLIWVIKKDSKRQSIKNVGPVSIATVPPPSVDAPASKAAQTAGTLVESLAK
jgi:hypothetical protein